MDLEIEYQDQFGKYKTKYLENTTVIPHIGDFIYIDSTVDNREVKSVIFYYEDNRVFIQTRM